MTPIDATIATTPPRPVPSWDEYFMTLAEAVSLRSKDPRTQIGAILIDRARRIVSTGYNGPPPGFPDEELDWSRPAKYEFIRHAEANAIAFSRMLDLAGCTLYVTGHPCSKCLLELAAIGVKEVVYSHKEIACITPADAESSLKIAAWAGISLVKFSKE